MNQDLYELNNSGTGQTIMVNLPPTIVKNIYQRINAVMQEVDYIQKSEKKVAGQYRFVSHDQVTAALHIPMTKHGIVVKSDMVEMKQDGNRTEVKLKVTFVNIDDPSDYFDVFYYGYGIDTSDKGIGKAVSYAFKYALLKTCLLETGDDPDQDQETKYEPPKPQVPEMTAEELEEYICSFGENAPKFTEWVIWLAAQKKLKREEAVALCKKNPDTVRLFEKWLEKDRKK